MDDYYDDLSGQMLGAYDQQILGAGFPLSRGPMFRPMLPSPGRAFVRPPFGPGLPVRSPLTTPFPGAPGPSGMETYLGFPAAVVTDTSALLFQLVTTPQRLVRPKKLVIEITRAGAGVVNPAIVINSLFVGPINQFSDANPLPAGAFNGQNTHYIIGTSAAPGTNIVLTIAANINAAATESVTVNCMLCCDAIG